MSSLSPEEKLSALINFGIPKPTAIELLSMTKNNVERAVSLYFDSVNSNHDSVNSNHDSFKNSTHMNLDFFRQHDSNQWNQNRNNIAIDSNAQNAEKRENFQKIEKLQNDSKDERFRKYQNSNSIHGRWIGIVVRMTEKGFGFVRVPGQSVDYFFHVRCGFGNSVLV